MSIDFILPDIGEGIVECELVEWLVKEGDIIEEDQPIADVMTDKALVQIPAMHSGVVEQLFYKQGDIAKVHAPLYSMKPHHELDKSDKANAELVITEDVLVSTDTSDNTAEQVKEKIPDKRSDNQAPTEESSKVLASPAVRRVARELDVNISEVTGSGKKGRVYKDDVVAFEQMGKNVMAARHGTSVNIMPSQVKQPNRVEKMKGIQAIMAKAMVESVSTIPHFTYCDEIDLTVLIKLRSSLKENSVMNEVLAKHDSKLTMMPFFIKAISLALLEFPVINSQVNKDCSELTYFNDHNIGMAVDSALGLLVPNVKQVQTKSILDLAIELSRLTLNARSGRVQSSDLKGGTITVSNIGAIGGTLATPIINKPESAIVALGKVQVLPRFNDKGEVKAHSIMPVSWSGDHRVIDGGTIARFCNLWKSFLENPATMLVHMR